jgi:DNA repair exonuclease SbcCD ATPase subunit
MATILRILGWTAEGLRCPDHEVNCCDANGQPFAVSLIQMPNGTGKTTTLSLLRAALSGAGEDGSWDATRVREYRKKGSTSATATFALRLSLNGRRLTVTMEFDFDAGRVEFRTTYGSGQESGFRPPLELRRFMSEDFVNFFVFDGELAENLLSKRHTDAEKAVESLFQVHLLNRMAAKVSDYWEDKTRDVTAKDDRGYTRRKNLLDKWRRRLEALEEQKGNLDQTIKNTSAQLQRQKERYDQEIAKEEKRGQEIKRAESVVSELEDRVHDNAKQVLDEMRGPHALSTVFATEMHELKTGLDRVKLPESAAREFFEELADESECVCGRPIDGSVRAVIRTRAQQYLGSDDVALLNAMKSAIADVVGDSRDRPAADLTQNTTALSDLVDQLNNAKNELDLLHQAAERSDPDVMQAKTEIDALRDQLLKSEKELERFTGRDEKLPQDRIRNTDPERVYSIPSVREAVDLLEDEFAEVTNTLTLRDRRDALRSILDIAYRKSRAALASEIRDEANANIGQLMPYNNIRIEEIDRCLVLRGQSGGSVGETLSVGYAFLSTLFNRADQHQLPFVVDSPANPIDFEIRSKIGELVPQLTGQFVAFMISSEREKFLASLKKASDHPICYMTLFRKGATPHEAKAKNCPTCVITNDGYMVVDERFFNDFQLDAEEP